MPDVMELYDVLRARGIEPESNRYAAEVTLDELRRAGRLEPVDAARIQALRVLAAAVDVDVTNAALWAQYRKALEEMMAGGDSGDDPFAAAAAALRGTTPLRNPTAT